MKSHIEEWIKPLLPLPFRKRAGEMYQNFRFNRAFRKFLKNPQDCIHPESPLLKELRDCWGNSQWSADDRYLAAVIESSLNSPGTILECGSGLTTLLAGACAEKNGVSLIAFEHNEKWVERVQFYLEKYRIGTAAVIFTPLITYQDEEFDWYRVPVVVSDQSISLIICDGPPGSTRGGRYGLVPVMKRYFSTPCRILLDDAERDEERQIAERWRKETGAALTRVGRENPYFILDCP